MRRRLMILVGLALFASMVLSLLRSGALERAVYEYESYSLTGALPPAANQTVPTPRADKRVEVAPMAAVLTFLAQQPSFSIVQIGAYVGNTPNDPLYAFLCKHLYLGNATDAGRKAKVILVEPIREYFDLLCKNYSCTSGIEFENVAIAETEGEREMYRLNANPVKYGFPAWLAQLSSLKHERMEELWNEYENNAEYKAFYLKHRIVEKVRCMTLQQLLERHEVRKLDLLQIDAEGYDYEILKTLDFDKVKPRFINYERVLLEEDEPACRTMLSAHGYVLIDWGQDTLCILIEKRG